jgi:hypothetical protein
LDVDKLVDPEATDLVKIAVPKDGQPVFINFRFDEAFEARSITYEVRPKGKATTSATNVPAPPQATFVGTGYRILPDLGQLEVSDDGVEYRKVCDLKPIYRAHESWRQKSISFATVKGKFYRLKLNDWWEEDDRSPDMQLGKLVIHGVAKIDQWEEKAGLFAEYMEEDATPEYASDEVIDGSAIVDLTDKMDKDGVLRWQVPVGDWMVMRFAYVPTGGASKHGRKNLMGLECDKLSVEAAELQWDNYVGVMLDSLKMHGLHNLVGVAMDSHEAGAQNWTAHFVDEFKVRRSYDPTLWLPTMMGYVIDDKISSQSFLYDVRRSIADLISDNYYGTFERLCRDNGLVFTAQAIGNALCIVGDPLQSKSKVAKPQGEFWQIHPDGNYDIKESSSAAHLYGKQIASAEAYTDAKYSASLADLKSLADYAYSYGINEFVICASAYQPWIGPIPGSTGGGRHYCINRNNTWWNYSRPFWDYQARAAYMLRQGRQQTDLCVYLGDDPPVKILTHRLPDIPGGFDFDAFTGDALMTRMTASEGRIDLPDGHSYRMMVLPRSGRISLEALRKIADLVENGAQVYGTKPIQYGSKDELAQSGSFDRLVEQLWDADPDSQGVRRIGKGTIYTGMSLKEALDKATIAPDISLSAGNTKDNKLYFVHRRCADADVYFLDNHKDETESNIFLFAANRKNVQIWDPVMGRRYRIDSEYIPGRGSKVALSLAARQSVMVVLTDRLEHLPLYQPPLVQAMQGLQLDKDWSVDFDRKWGGPGMTHFAKLEDWTLHADTGIRYYSGTAIYKKDFHLIEKPSRAQLYTGNPGSVARIFINGEEAGILWCSPWQLDIAPYLEEGNNTLEIQVANSLINRMVLDASLDECERITYAYPALVSENDPLIPSGLREVKIVYE